MKVSNSSIARFSTTIAAVALLPLAAIAGDKDKTMTPMGTKTSAQFDTLDTNRDGRLSPAEATSDSKIVFSKADKNGDGYLDSSEWMHSEKSNDAMPNSTDPSSDTATPRQ